MIAHEKSEDLLTWKRNHNVMDIQIEGHPVRTKKEIRYLGVQLHNCRRFGAHIEKVCNKADSFMGALRTLLANVNGSTGSVRKLYYGV